jgi:cytochrome c-type biogenesis protein CcmH/NrfG
MGANDHGRAWVPIALKMAILVLAAAGVSWSGLNGSFVLDDIRHVLNNPSITDLGDPGRVLTGSRRPLVNLTLAINYAAGTFDVAPYHMTNIFIHVLATMACFLFLRESCRLAGGTSNTALMIAFTGALLWSVHPLQTQSVTYIIQRGESMMGLFYLLAMFTFVRGLRMTGMSGMSGMSGITGMTDTSTRRCAWPWYLACVLCIVLGLLCKAVIVTAPVMMVVIDRCLRRDSFAHMLRSRWPVYAGAFATWLVLFPLGIAAGVFDTTPEGSATVGFGYTGISPMQYLITQSLVIMHYLGLCIWPFPLVIDYGWPPATFGEAWGAMLILGALLLATVIAIARRSWWGAIGGWFFIVLAPTSSFVPIADLAFEHRMYLPLLSVVIIGVLAVRYVTVVIFSARDSAQTMRRAVGATILTVVAGALAVRTWNRNADYATPSVLWSDAVGWNPNHLRGWVMLGNSHFIEINGPGAQAAYETATQLAPERAGVQPDDSLYLDAWVGLATVLDGTGQMRPAMEAYEEVLRRNPDHLKINRRLAALRQAEGRPAEAILRLEKVRELDPADIAARMELGNLYATTGDFERAYVVYVEVMTLQPNNVEALSKVAGIEMRFSRFEHAEAKLLRAYNAAPRQPNISYMLGVLYEMMQRPDDAVEAYDRALRLDATMERARTRLNLLRNPSPGVPPPPPPPSPTLGSSL